MKTLIPIIIVALLIIIAGAFYFSNDTPKDNTTISTTEEVTTETNTTGTPNTVPPAQNENTVQLSPVETGKQVTVASAQLDKSGYVVIYQVDSNNKSDIIGSSDYLTAGSYTNIIIPLDQIVAREQTVIAVLHEDDGDSAFEFPGADGYLISADGTLTTDVDVVDVDSEDEAVDLEEKIEVSFQENTDLLESN